MEKKHIIILSFILFLTLTACRSNNDVNKGSIETATLNTTTLETSQTEETTTTELAFGTEVFAPISLELLVNDPISKMPDADFDILADNGKIDVIGEGNKVYLRYNDSYYMVWDIGAPVSEFVRASFRVLDSGKMKEIFIYDHNEGRTKVLSYDSSSDAYRIILDAGKIVTFGDEEKYYDYVFYSADKDQAPYKLYIYYFKQGKFLIQDVSLATGNEYSTISDGRYIFAGTGRDISMYTLAGMELHRMDASPYITSRNVFPDSSTKALTLEDLKEANGYELADAVNEIYSRHGYISDDEDIQEYFEWIPWYVPDETFKLSMLSDIEKANVELINKYIESLTGNLKTFVNLHADADINGDGKTDNISLEIDGDNYTIIINDKTVEGKGDCLMNKLYVMDIDTKDQYMEVAVSEEGPSNDYASYIYYYNGSDIVFMGRVEGAGNNFILDGSGELLTYKRGHILQTWFYAYAFGIDSGHMLSGMDKDEYPMNTFVILKEDLDVYGSKTGAESKFVIKAGEPALILSSDNISACRIRNGSGEEGYFYVTDNGINDTGVNSMEYFSGLSAAD